MRKSPIYLTCAAAALSLLGSCNDSSTIGSSIVQDEVKVVVDSAFTVESKSVPMHRVQSRTTSQLLGRFDAKGYGMLSSDIVTQFMPASKLFASEVTVSDIDSLVLYMFMLNNEFVGDSLVPMGMDVYRLNKLLPSPIYSDFDPAGYYDPQPIASKVYNVSKRSAKLYADSVYAQGVELKVNLPLELAREIYGSYKSNPANFASPTAFADNVFKGVYIKNSFGSGRLMRLSSTLMTLYYHHYYAEEDTTIYGQGNYFAVTPEIITNNDVTFDISKEMQQRVAQGENIVMAPVGLEVEMRFPTPEIIAAYNSNKGALSVFNTLTFRVPAEGIVNDYQIGYPKYLLMVLSKDKENFFANNQLPDNVTSFYATYDEATGSYDFGDMRPYVIEMLSKESIAEEDYTFRLIPVSATFENTSSSIYSTAQTLQLITPYMGAPVMARLFLDRAKIKVSYSSQTIQK